MLVGFSMCDGNVDKSLNKTRFFFRRKNDALMFTDNFQRVFYQEKCQVYRATVGNSYVVALLRATDISNFLHFLGSPKGNKVFQSFTIPDWIYYGSDKIKQSFLSVVIGNEGSAPSNNKWRIQFVLSKSKENVPNLLKFLNQVRAMLNHFNISSSHIQLRKQEGRQFHGRFYIKGKHNLRKFYKQFSFLYASEKQEVLNELISKEAS